jgi:ketosteroid isomerase-like protein
MLKKFPFVLMAVLSLIMFSCSSTKEKKSEAVDIEKVRPTIQAMEDAYAAAEKAKNSDAVVAYYSEDAISYHRNEEASVGKPAIKEYMNKRFEKDTSGNTNVYKVVDLSGDGNVLVEIGSWSEVSPAGTETDHGYYMSYFKKNGDKYECYRDMSVSTKSKEQ